MIPKQIYTVHLSSSTRNTTDVVRVKATSKDVAEHIALVKFHWFNEATAWLSFGIAGIDYSKDDIIN